MATEYLHPSEELRGVMRQTTKRKLLYTVAMLSIEEEVTLVKYSRKAKAISSAEEHECGAEMPMSHRLAGCLGCIQELFSRLLTTVIAVHPFDIDLVEIQKRRCDRAVSSTL
jgi:hypothetical protein